MTTTELHRAVARRTGETPDRIARHGFQIAGPAGDRPSYDDDPESYVIDWDAAEAARLASCRVDPFPPPSKRTATL